MEDVFIRKRRLMKQKTPENPSESLELFGCFFPVFVFSIVFMFALSSTSSDTFKSCEGPELPKVQKECMRDTNLPEFSDSKKLEYCRYFTKVPKSCEINNNSKDCRIRTKYNRCLATGVLLEVSSKRLRSRCLKILEQLEN